MNWFVIMAARDIHNGNIFHHVQRQGASALDLPQQVTLGDAADILTVQTEDGNTGLPVVLHLLQCLAECLIFVYVGDIFLWG